MADTVTPRGYAATAAEFLDASAEDAAGARDMAVRQLAATQAIGYALLAAGDQLADLTDAITDLGGRLADIADAVGAGRPDPEINRRVFFRHRGSLRPSRRRAGGER